LKNDVIIVIFYIEHDFFKFQLQLCYNLTTCCRCVCACLFFCPAYGIEKWPNHVKIWHNWGC